MMRVWARARLRLAERKFPALLVIWAYQKKQLRLEEGSFFFARKRDFLFLFFSPLEVFLCYWGVFFVLLGGGFCVFGFVFVFRAQREIFLGS